MAPVWVFRVEALVTSSGGGQSAECGLSSLLWFIPLPGLYWTNARCLPELTALQLVSSLGHQGPLLASLCPFVSWTGSLTFLRLPGHRPDVSVLAEGCGNVGATTAPRWVHVEGLTWYCQGLPSVNHLLELHL